MKFQQKIIFPLAAILLLVAMGFFAYSISSEEKEGIWENLLKSHSYSNNIVSISLKKQLVYGVDFEDEDLLHKWKDFLENLEVKKYHKLSKKDMEMNGGGYYCTIKTDSEIYSFSFKEPYNNNAVMLLMNDVFYYFKSNVPNPFEETYDVAKERHGEIELWKSSKVEG